MLHEGCHIILLQIHEIAMCQPFNKAVPLIIQCTIFINKCCFKNQCSPNGVCLKNAEVFLWTVSWSFLYWMKLSFFLNEETATYLWYREIKYLSESTGWKIKMSSSCKRYRHCTNITNKVTNTCLKHKKCNKWPCKKCTQYDSRAKNSRHL